MAKKDKKKKDSPQDRGREIVDELAKAVGRIREELSQRNVSDDLKSLRSEVEGLARRVAALEVPGRGSSSAKPRAASRSTAAKKPAASRSTAAKKPAASRSTAAKKPAASRSTAAKKPAASRSAATRSRSTSSRSRSSGSSS